MEPNRPGLVVVLAGALACALLVIAFLLGRMSAKPVVPPQATISEDAAMAARAATDVRPVESEHRPQEDSAAPVEADLTSATPATLPGLERTAPATSFAPAARAVASPSPDRPQIVAYFDQIERIAEVGGGDPQAFATTLLHSVSSGDFSGFDNLAAQARAQHERLRGVSPPPVCREHHRLALALASDSVIMLERLRTAIAKGDTAALMAMTTEGRTIEAQANQLKLMGEAIRQQAGI